MACCCAVQSTESESVVVGTVKAIGLERDDPQPVPEHPAESPPPIVEEKPPLPEPPTSPTAEPELVVDKASAELTVKIAKENGQTVGLELNVLTDAVMWVQAVQPAGAIAVYNQANGEASGISPGDHIVRVNNISASDHAKVIDLLQKESSFEISLKKCNEVTLTIPKDGKLGLDLRYHEANNHIMVIGLVEGAVQAYNANASPDQQFKTPSRIVGVEGFRGPASEMFERVQAAGSSITFIVSQPIG